MTTQRQALVPELLRESCDPSTFDFETTDEVQEMDDVVGQERALAAVELGIKMKREGYNIFAIGPHGIGKRYLIQHYLDRLPHLPPPKDWCYVNHFKEPRKPAAIGLPAGRGIELKEQMERFLEAMEDMFATAFESEEYQVRRQIFEDEAKKESEQAIESLQERAQANGLVLLRTPVGFVFAPVHDGEVLPPDEFQKLAEEERKKLEKISEELQQELQKVMNRTPFRERKKREKVRQLNRDMIDVAIRPWFEELREKYTDLPEVLGYLDAVREDVLSQVEQLDNKEREFSMRSYHINLIVDNSKTQHTPIVEVSNPTYRELFGNIERFAHMGTLETDYQLIRPGALHRANGGYLILEARKLLSQPFAWESLKRALKRKEIRIELVEQMLAINSTISLEPQPIPLQVKVILLGDRMLYYLLSLYDPEFETLFKAAADFGEDIARTPENQRLYTRLLATLIKREDLLPFSRGAVARLLDQSVRLAGDTKKFSIRMSEIRDLLLESEHWARERQATLVEAQDVHQAIEALIFRSDRAREQLLEATLRETLLIHTEGSKVGQINGLAVIQFGRFSFGRPNRITARARIGKGEVIDIEREVKLGGPLHTKGVLILSNYLAAQYATEQPLSLSASLVFEQSYGAIDGDSASSAELYVLLSAIAQVPLRQDLAVTGSVNQFGEIQPIGGVNEKIEGFFDLCKARGLTGTQGVLIPKSNIKHLMLRPDVVYAASQKKFHVFAVETVQEGIELLTGMPAGEVDEQGSYPEDSFNARVSERLQHFLTKRLSFQQAESSEPSKERTEKT
ncbi:MAG: AAA family ATPase [Myxococcales bacterium]|nr:AAA family ATPase [Myxococcales bacterium]MCB9643237.1 AAA family ATPase [Myxococcales bacterium]